jgi:hypothetical protein
MDTLDTPGRPAGNDSCWKPQRPERTDGEKQQQQAGRQEERDRPAAGPGEPQE